MNRLFLFMLLLTAVLRVAAQEPVFRHYTTEGGLPSSEVYCVMQDSKGYMWFGTETGIVKFDGYEFSTVSSANGLKDNTIFLLTEDATGRIWYASYSGKTGYLKNDTVHQYRYEHLIRSFMSSGLMKGIAADHKGRLWLSKGRPEEAKIAVIDAAGNADLSLNKSFKKGMMDVYIAEKGQKFCSGSERASTIRVISMKTGELLGGFPNTRRIDDIISYKKDSSVWIYTAGTVWHIRQHTCTRVTQTAGKAISMFVDDQDNLWLGYLHNGIALHEARHGYAKPVRFRQGYSISGICQDREGGMWFTTHESGIFYLPPGFCFSYGKENGLPQSKVLRILNIDNDALLVLSNRQLARHIPDSGFKIVTGKNIPEIVDVVSRKDGSLYCAVLSSSSGYGKLLGKKTLYLPNQTRLYSGPYHTWGRVNSEVTRYGGNGEKLQLTTLNAIGRVTCMYEQADSSLLIGTVEGIFEYRKGKLNTLGRHHPLLQSRISDITGINDEHLLISTVGAGLLLIKRNDYRHPLSYGIEDGLPSTTCNVILRESDSVTWVGTNRGLCRITNITHPERAAFHITDISNGIISNEISDLSIINGALWTGTMNGLSILPLTGRPPKSYHTPLYIRSILANGENSPTGAREFSFDRNNISFSFAALNYQYAGKLKYQYRLKGIRDTSWHITSNRSVSYNTLQPGNYIFELKPTIPGRIASMPALHYPFRVLPPFWNTWWFLSGAVLMLAAMIYLFVYYRIRFVRKQAQNRNDLNRFREKALRSQMNPHFIYNSMNSIQNYVRKNDLESSSVFLSKFSLLMRQTFNNSDKELIPLEKELETLQLYTDMERMRFPGRFLFHAVSPSHPGKILVPPLLIQPFIENAILHGFATRTEQGNIWLDIRREGARLEVIVKDDGIGIHKALQIKKRKEKYLVSEKRDQSGTSITIARIRQAWGKYIPPDIFEILDLSDEDGTRSGTVVRFFLPIKHINHDQSDNRR